MKAGVIVFPGSNCDRDVAVALELVTGTKPAMVWHGDTELPDLDLIVLPGGFSYGDYLRCGAMASKSAVMASVIAAANKGVSVLGICNGFQVLTESGLLPGALIRNAGLTFICKTVGLEVARTDTRFAAKYAAGSTIQIPVAHHDGNFVADADTLAKIEDQSQVAFRYTDNPNGSLNNIAGIYNQAGNVLGLMPHPERVADPALGNTDGRAMFESLLEALS